MNEKIYQATESINTLQDYTDFFSKQLKSLDLIDIDHGATHPSSGLDISQIPFSTDSIDSLIQEIQKKEVGVSAEEIDVINLKIEELKVARNKFMETANTVTEAMRALAKALPERNFAFDFETAFRILVRELTDEHSKYNEIFKNPALLPLMENLKIALTDFDTAKKRLHASNSTYLSLNETLQGLLGVQVPIYYAQSGIHDPERVQATELTPIDTVAAKVIFGTGKKNQEQIEENV